MGFAKCVERSGAIFSLIRGLKLPCKGSLDKQSLYYIKNRALFQTGLIKHVLNTF